MADNKFVFTDQMVNDSNKLWAVTSIVGAGLCFLVLSVISVVRLHRISRPHLDRVSFRLLVWALGTNTVFGVANAVGGNFTGPTWACGFSMFILQFTLEFSSFLIFCIALNLQLVVVHHINGQKMERYYILISLALSLCLTIPPYAAKQYGWDPLVQDCWYANDNQKQRFAWQIGTQLVWTMMTVVGEVCATMTVAIYMIKHRKSYAFLQLSRRRAMGSSTYSRGSFRRWSTSSNLQHANAYKNVMIRIALYPLASCIINITSVACVIHATFTDGIKDMSDYRVLLLSDFVYGGRAIVYALLAATDPSLVRALKALSKHHTNSSVSSIVNDTAGKPVASPHMRIELTRIRDESIGGVSPIEEEGLGFGPFVQDALPVQNKHREPGGSMGRTATGDDKGGSQLDNVQEISAIRDLRRRHQEASEREESFKRQI